MAQANGPSEIAQADGSSERAKLLSELHPDIVVGEHDNFVLRIFEFALGELEDRVSRGAVTARVHSSPGVSGLMHRLTEPELAAVREVIRQVQAKRVPVHRDEPPAKKRGYDVISVIRFSCGAFDVQSVVWGDA